MNVRASSDASRIAGRIGRSIRQASAVAAVAVPKQSHSQPQKPPRRSRREQHGQQIYVYSHLQTRQVVYSLSPAVKNNHALRQLPYNGKKTIPSALRKDLWYPMATIEFTSTLPNAPQLGLSTFQKLREYRKLHELSWPEEDMAGLSRKQRGRKLCDQRANTVADMAAALDRVLSAEAAAAAPNDASEESTSGAESEQDGRAQASSGVPMATVKWADILDAEYAESWPKAIVHDSWDIKRNNRSGERPAAFEVKGKSSKAVDTSGLPIVEAARNQQGKVVL